MAITCFYLSFSYEVIHGSLNELVKNSALVLLWNNALHQLSFTLTRQ